MEKREKTTLIVMIGVLLMLILDFGFLLIEHMDYKNRKEAGNTRWQQVEERIKEIEEGCGCE